LGQAQVIETKRGKGDFYLAEEPADINIGEMVILMANSLEIVDCERQRCVIKPA
jgi:Rrf2 family nitric oxide-sensitive transcriptional repressor